MFGKSFHKLLNATVERWPQLYDRSNPLGSIAPGQFMKV
jgi:hypothetical protein